MNNNYKKYLLVVLIVLITIVILNTVMVFADEDITSWVNKGGEEFDIFSRKINKIIYSYIGGIILIIAVIYGTKRILSKKIF